MPDSVIVTLPVVYEIEFLPPKKRAPVKRWVVEGAPAAIRVVKPSDAPIVVQQDRGFPGERPFDMRVHDGRLFGQLTDLLFMVDGDLGQKGAELGIKVNKQRPPSSYESLDGMSQIVFTMGMGMAADRLAFVDSDLLPLPIPKSSEKTRPVALDDIVAGKILSSGRDQAINRFCALASERIIFVDGIVYVEEPEPCMEVHGGSKRRSVSIFRSHRVPKVREKDDSSVAVYLAFPNVERLSEMCQIEPGYDNESWIVDMGHPWTQQVDAMQARTWADRVVRHMHDYGQSFLKGSDDLLLAFMELRRISQAVDADLRRTKELVDLVVETIKADANTPTEQANRIERMSMAVQERIEMFGYERDEEDRAKAAELDSFEI